MIAAQWRGLGSRQCHLRMQEKEAVLGSQVWLQLNELKILWGGPCGVSVENRYNNRAIRDNVDVAGCVMVHSFRGCTILSCFLTRS